MKENVPATFSILVRGPWARSSLRERVMLDGYFPERYATGRGGPFAHSICVAPLADRVAEADLFAVGTVTRVTRIDAGPRVVEAAEITIDTVLAVGKLPTQLGSKLRRGGRIRVEPARGQEW